MSASASHIALGLLLWPLFFLHPLSVCAATALTDSITLSAIVSAYEELKPKVRALVADMREARKVGQRVESGKVLLVRKDLGDVVKTLRRYDKDHLRAAKGAKTYPDREQILRLLHASDLIHRLIEAETKATDFQMLALKYEETWRQADAARAEHGPDDR